MKDLYVNRKYIFIAILYLGFAMFFIPDNQSSSFVFAMAISYGIVTRSCFNDDRDRGGIFLRTLPIRASTIIISKYILGILILLMDILIFILLSIIGGQDLKILYESISLLVFALSLAYSVYLPIFFKYGYMKATTFQTVFFIGIMILSFTIRNLASIIGPLNIAGWQKSIGALINFIELSAENCATLMLISYFIAFIMLTISAMISLKFYTDSNA